MPPRKRDYRKEYRQRTRRRGIPLNVARGHGTIPADVAVRLEKGELKAGEKRKYEKQIKSYEKQYGPAGGGRAGRKRKLARGFETRQDARDYATEHYGLSADYVRITERDERFYITLLR